MPEAESKQEANNSLTGNIIVCPRCAASRVAKSRLRNSDKARMQFLPVRPYRCLHCYHRFWTKERFAAEKKRVWSWLLIIIALLIFVIFLSVGTSQHDPTDENQTGRDEQLAQGGDSLVERESVIQPVVEQPTADPEELEAVSARLEEYGWYLSESESEPTKLEPTEGQAEVVGEGVATPEVTQDELEVAVEERESLLKVIIARRMKQWRIAWENGDIDTYLSHYSDSFVPTNWLSLEQWRALRTDRVTPLKKIKLVLSEFEVTFSDEYQTVAVEFNQRYQSNTYLDNSMKRIVWVKEGESWKIASEREIQ